MARIRKTARSKDLAVFFLFPFEIVVGPEDELGRRAGLWTEFIAKVGKILEFFCIRNSSFGHKADHVPAGHLGVDANESHDCGRLSCLFHEGEIMLVVLIVYLPGSIDLLDRARVAS